MATPDPAGWAGACVAAQTEKEGKEKRQFLLKSEISARVSVKNIIWFVSVFGVVGRGAPAGEEEEGEQKKGASETSFWVEWQPRRFATARETGPDSDSRKSGPLN